MKNYTVKDYEFNTTVVRYIILEENKKVFLQLIPKNCDAKTVDKYQNFSIDGQFADCYDFFAGSLCHIRLAHHSNPPYCNSLKLSDSYDDMYFKDQRVLKSEEKTVIETFVVSDEGYEIVHTLTNHTGEDGFAVECTFANKTGKDVELDMITSASLDNLSPYNEYDSSENIYFHAFRSGWATEGKHIVSSIAELNLEKSWGGNFVCEKIGSQGSRPTEKYFPYAALEDRNHNVMWGVQLYHNASWQIELSRMGKDLSLSCGIADKVFGNWFKVIKSGESFSAPKAHIAAVKGGIEDLSDVFLKMRERDISAYSKDEMDIVFNEWCTTWGKPSHEGNLKIVEKLKDSKTKYYVMDDGWFDGTIGDWLPKESAFPNGLKAYTKDLRNRGIIPGIWMEFECTGEGSKYFQPEYDDMHLKNNGKVIVGVVNKSRKESFWDFTNPDAYKLLKSQVIDFLKENDFGYLKVDYNANIGNGCDGAESKGEGLRLHLEKVREFFADIKKEIPDIIIENCSSGGMRLEASMLAVSGMCSFSDAHECIEFPIVAANLHYLVPPCQSQVWNVLKPEFTFDRFSFTVSAGFLGRICWSGDVMGLSNEQMNHIYNAEAFYEDVSDIIRHGKSTIYRTEDMINFRHPKGTQAVIRYSDKGDRALIVYHTFENPKKLEVELDGKWAIEKALYPAKVSIDSKVTIDESKEIFGNVILLKRRK